MVEGVFVEVPESFTPWRVDESHPALSSGLHVCVFEEFEPCNVVCVQEDGDTGECKRTLAVSQTRTCSRCGVFERRFRKRRNDE